MASDGLRSTRIYGNHRPEEYGGLGLGDLTLIPILEEMGRAVVPGPYLETVASPSHY